jgi:hypothetical protein
MTSFPLRQSPKPSFKRNKPTAKQRGSISPSVRLKAKVRANSHCEMCGRHERQVWGLQCAHLVRRWKLTETTEHDVAMLCGPSVNTGTCHNKIDYTAEGRKWALDYHMKLLQVSE